jgi:hypothetical protein
VRKISPTPGFDPRTVQAVTSRYTDWAVSAKSQNGVAYFNVVKFIIPSAGRRRWQRVNGRGFGRKWSGLIDVIDRHMSEGPEGNHANIRVKTECAPTQFRTECLLITCRALSFRYLCAHFTQLNYQNYCSHHLPVSMSSASFPLAILK